MKSATMEVWTGKEDRLLRRLRIDVDFELELPDRVREALGGIRGGRFLLDLGVTRPNSPVRVSPPPDPRPYSELAAGG